MTTIRVLNRTRGTVLGTQVRMADRLTGRTRGYLFRPPPAPGEGILLSPCQMVHMFGVRFPLDVVFISATGQVVATYPELRPWRWSRLHGSALHALELPPGTIRATGTAVGDDLSWSAAVADPGAVELPVPEAARPAPAPADPMKAPRRARPPEPALDTAEQPAPAAEVKPESELEAAEPTRRQVS
jgi:uncharacterized protein